MDFIFVESNSHLLNTDLKIAGPENEKIYKGEQEAIAAHLGRVSFEL
jgi:hypothetical protein